MKKVLLALVGLTAAMVSATAADLPRNRRNIPAQAYAPAPLAAQGGMMWNGGYIGGHLGYAFNGQFSGNNAWSVSGGKSAFGGLQAGYDWRFGSVVAGVAADASLMSVSAKDANAVGSIPWNASLRGRLGFLPTERLLVYGTAGAAASSVKIDRLVIPNIGTESKTRLGYTLGVGAEYAFSQNLSGLLEYRYTSFGRSGYGSLGNVSYDASFHSLRAGLNYRF